MTMIPAEDIRDGDVIKFRGKCAKVIEEFKDVTVDKGGCVITVQILKNKGVKTFRVKPDTMFERVRYG